MNFKNLWPGIALSLCFLVVGILTLSDYGMNEDSPLHFLRGQSYLHLLTTGTSKFDQPQLPSPTLFISNQRMSTYKLNAAESNTSPLQQIVYNPNGLTVQEIFKKYRDLAGRQSFYKSNAWTGEYFDRGPGHPPVSDELEALSNHIFYEVFGVLGDVESYHLYSILTAVLAIFLVYVFANHVWGRVVAIISSATLALYPIFFSESHFNIKDIPELAFFAGSIITFYFWFKAGKLSYFIFFTILFFLGLGTKFNILFVPLILILWLFLIRKTPDFKKWFTKRLFVYGSIFLLANIVLLVLIWPYLWDSPVQRIIEVLRFYKDVGSVDPSIQTASPFLLPFGIDASSILLFFTGMPIVTLIGFVFGLYQSFKDSKKAEVILVFLWFIIPLARVVRPGAAVFGSVRQFIELLPAVAIIAGFGINYLLKKLPKYINTLVGIFYIFSMLVILVVYHPNENVYFNQLVGGIKGAVKIKLFDWQASYSNPYRQGVDWLNTHAEKDAKLAYLDGTMVAIPSIWLRNDIRFGSYFSAFDQKGEYVISIVYPQPPQVFAYLYLERFLRPVYEIKADGVTIAVIWKNDKKFIKEDYSQFDSLSGLVGIKGSDKKFGDFWQINLDKKYKITNLRVSIPSEGCSKRDGLFYLNNYMIPQRKDISKTVTDFYFPAEETNTIRFYGLIPDTCFMKAVPINLQFVK